MTTKVSDLRNKLPHFELELLMHNWIIFLYFVQIEEKLGILQKMSKAHVNFQITDFYFQVNVAIDE